MFFCCCNLFTKYTYIYIETYSLSASCDPSMTYGQLFLAPKEGCSLWLQRWGPSGPLLCFFFVKKNILAEHISGRKKLQGKKSSGRKKMSGIWQVAGGSWHVVFGSWQVAVGTL